MILSEATIAEIKKKAAQLPSARSAILPALTAAYNQIGYLHPVIYREISSIIGMPYLEVAEAASFYSLFPKQEVGRYLIQVCHNISCSLNGADNMVAYLEDQLGIHLGETTEDKMFTLIPVECLGGCTAAPMMQINDRYYENLTRQKIDNILSELRRSAEQEER